MDRQPLSTRSRVKRRALLRAGAAALVPLLLAACAGQSPIASPGQPPGPAATAAGAAPRSSSPAPNVVEAAVTPIGPGPTPIVQFDVVAQGLDTPWAIAFAPDGRIFVTERPGRVRIIQNGQLQTDAWATFDVFERDSAEAGLLGIALDPEFAENRFVYLAYTYGQNGIGIENRLVRLRDDVATGRGVDEQVLLDAIPGNTSHDGGCVAFGPDGKLYWTMGDALDPDLAQDLSSLNGKILRLNSDGSVPADNPFPGSLVYSLGHRNPQGLAWQPESGRLYSTEHGPSGAQGCCLDELNLIEPGNNYGWPVIRGAQTAEGMVPPILISGETTTWAPGGATFVTRGSWRGTLLFPGLRGQALYRVTLDPGDPRRVLRLDTLFQGQFGRLRAVAEGPDGALYLLTSNRDGRWRPVAEDDRILRLRVFA